MKLSDLKRENHADAWFSQTSYVSGGLQTAVIPKALKTDVR
jgi:hypothetical protein